MRIFIRQSEVVFRVSRAMRKRELTVMMALVLNMQPGYASSPQLPVPGSNFVHAGDASYLFNSNNLTINQRSDRAILNWQSFNVHEGNSVTFNQPDSSSIALNRIFQNDPSEILGTINANGQIYLYNQNGFIFGKNVRFNANNIVATTLDVDNELFLNSSILNAIENGQPAFFDSNGNNSGIIRIENGAEITAKTILMIAPDIVNQGVLNSADGQTILAASKDKVYLAASDKDPDLRGLLVEVGSGGTVTNAGSINAQRGNVTLIGYAVNQSGRIRATTSVDKNGSIRLLARDNAIVFENTEINFNDKQGSIGVDEKPTAAFLAQAQNAGQVILGENSITEIAVDSDTVTKVPDAQQQLSSKVEIVANKVWLKNNSKIIAPSAEVIITATETPANPLLSGTGRNDSYVYMETGSIIDVSGTDTAILPMERNSVAVEIRSNELADASLQRDGVLKGETIFVDLRKGTDLVDYSGAVAVVEKSVVERLVTGGSIDIRSEGDFVQREGAVLDISGGKLTYEDGFIKETRLISKGQIISLSEADKFRQYDGILGANTKLHDRWAVTESFTSSSGTSTGRFVNSFEQGKAAGRINITAAATILAADGIRAGTTLGPYQTEVNLLPDRGELNINLTQFINSSQDVTFVLASILDKVSDDIANAPNPVALQRDNIKTNLLLPDSYLSNSGIAKLTVNSFNQIVIQRSANLVALPGSEINLSGSAVTVNGNIVNHAGSVNLSAVLPPLAGSDDRADLLVADNANIDVSGFWINNSGFGSDNPVAVAEFIDGGVINLSAEGDLSIEKTAMLNASAGALLDTEFNLDAGQGGDISLIAYHVAGATLSLNGELESYAIQSGGTLHLEATSVLVTDETDTAAVDNQLILSSKLFESGGFSRYEVVANAGDLIIDTVITPLMKNLSFNDNVAIHAGSGNNRNSILPLQATGTAISDIAQVATLVDFERQPVSLDFTLQQIVTDAGYNLKFTNQAAIKLDPGAILSFNSDTRILLAGKIETPAAEVSLTINAPAKETGFLADQAIWLADGSVIDVSSAAVYEKNDQGLRIGKIFDAGSVSLTANRGYVLIEDGARIDVSAKNKTLDLLVKTAAGGPEYQSIDVAPDAGTIRVLAAEGIVLDGELVADAAASPGAKGGELSLELNTNIRNISIDKSNSEVNKFNFTARDIVVVDSLGNRLNDAASFGDVIDSNLSGMAYLDVAKVESAGFDTVKLKTDHVVTNKTTASSEIRFESDVALTVKNTIVLSAPIVNVNDNDVQLSAAYVALGTDSASRNSLTTAPVPGSNQFSVDAALIDIIGDITLTNTAVANLNASNDIRFIGAKTVLNPEQLSSALTAAADINLMASQIYPATFSQASINLVNNPTAAVTIARNGEASPVLSALGNLSINAPRIIQGGVIKAPLGTINLNASESIVLLPGSLTSISAEGQIIPFGQTINAGGTWTYTVSTPAAIELADKSIELNAPDIAMQADSVVDISGGGDIFAYEFVSGPTGSSDGLLAKNAAGAFAILPASDSQYAAYDYLIASDTSNIGQQVYLEAGRDFDAGYYTILPARYALLPGAKLVTPFASNRVIFPGESVTRPDGASILAGKYATANTDIADSIYAAFVVEDGNIARSRSEYIETSANQFFTAKRPEDAAALVINTANSLSLAATIRGDHGEGTQGSRLDILADNIEVISADSKIKTDSFIQLTDSNLNELAVNSLMLGGNRRIGDDETAVKVQSGSVVIRENVSLELAEIYLVAKNQLTMQSGSSLNAKGVVSDRANNFVLDNNAAIVGVTANELPDIKRIGTGSGASISLNEGSVLAADNSIIVNSSNDVLLKATFVLDGGNLSLGAKNISLGTAPTDAVGLNLSSELIASLLVDKLEVNSIEAITVFEDINLAFNNLTITAPGINGQSGAGVDVQLRASGDVVLRQNGFVAKAGGIGNGSFNIDAKNIILAGNDEAFLFDGFAKTKFSAVQSIRGAGFSDGSNDVKANAFNFGNATVVFDTALLTGEAGSTLMVNSASDVSLINTSATVVDSAAVNALGAEFTVNASKIDVASNVIFPSGVVSLNAKGAGAADNVTIISGAYIDVSGRTVNYVDGSQAGSSSGLIRLSSAAGNVMTQKNSSLNISGADVAGDNGGLFLSASNGTAILSGQIEAVHADGFDGGSLRVDVSQLADIDAFIGQMQSGGFSRSQNYRVRNGDINIPVLTNSESNIKAGEIILTADSGAININGKLDASGGKSGRIEIFAAADIDVTGAILHAFAIDSANGGELLLASSNGLLSIDSSTQIDVAGNIAATRFDSGRVNLRAPRTNLNTDVAITNFDAVVNGAERIDIEAVAVYNDAVIGNAQQTVYRNDAASWLANKNTIASRLGLVGDDRVHYLAGVDVVNQADISINDAVDFYQWQQATADVIDEGSFTVRAGGNLNINASISDAVNNEAIYSLDFGGFIFDGPIAPVIKNGESWNYRLVSGADLNSANILATINDGLPDTGDLTLATNVSLRTGKGDITLSSGGDLILADQTSVIYTVGQSNGSGRFDAATIDFGALPDGPQFPDQGGDIRIDVSGDIEAAVSDQFFSDWLQRYGGITQLDNGKPISAMWAVIINDFEQGIATLGGGDIDIVAGGDISNLSVSTPKTGQLIENNAVIQRGGGNISMAAGGSIRSARLLADGGETVLSARGNVAADNGGLNTLLALGDASVTIEAGGDINIEGISNITMLPLSTLQSNSFVKLTDSKNTAYFFTYSDRSSVNLVSYYGDVTLNNDITAISNAPSNRFSGSPVFPWNIYPGKFSATTLTGDIVINNSFTLFPDADGNLNLLAARDVLARQNMDRKQVFVSVSDVAIAALPSIFDPENSLSGASLTEARLSGGTNDQSLLHDFSGPLHINDEQPLTVVANSNINANGELKIRSPKQSLIVAGNNISNLGVEIQHVRATDKSIVMAGGDISYSLPDTGSLIVSEGIQVTGPGSLTVLAGGDIRLGISRGIRSRGNIDNFILPVQGADIAVLAGIKNSGLNNELDTTSFIATYFKGEATGDAALIDIDIAGYQQQLVDFVLSEQYNGDLTQVTSTLTSQNYVSNTEAIAAIKTLDKSQQIEIAIKSYSDSKVSEQRKLIIDVLISELNLAAESQAKTKDDSEYARGFLAINSLFASPLSNETVLVTSAALAVDAEPHGDIRLPFSRIQSTAGGDINIFAPYGEITIGFTAEVANASPGAGSLGVVIGGQGDLSVMTQGNINVNLSRLQALDGGDISLWSSSGDIDAGRGAKTALTIPPPLTVVNKDTGQIEIIFPPAVSGSGINAGVSSDGLKPGKVVLAAPGGIVNASDGGIGSAGDLIVAASKVLGGDNFSAGGATVGVPVATNVTAGLSGLSSSTDDAINSASSAASTAAANAATNDAGVALVTVELLATDNDL